MKLIKNKKSVFSKRKRPYGRNMFKICYTEWLKKTHLDENDDATTSNYMLTNLEFEEFLKLQNYENDTNYGFIVGDVVKIDVPNLCGHWTNFENFEMTISKIDNNVYLEIESNKINDKLKKKLDSEIEKYPDNFKNVNNNIVELNNWILANCILVKSIFDQVSIRVPKTWIKK